MLKKYLFSCKEVTYLASDYIDNSTSKKLLWKIRLHLAACDCCRRFVRHLRITKTVSSQLVWRDPDIAAEKIFHVVKEKFNNNSP